MNNEDLKNLDLKIRNLESRILVLESRISEIKKSKEINGKVFSGPKGGILLLLNEGFYKNKKSATETQLELEKRNYFYKRQVIQTALNRLSGAKGVFVALTENNIKVYVERK